jgi:hypothetical protein
VAFLSALCGFIFARLKPTAGAELSGHLALVRQPPPSRPGGLDGA